jgi:hypothetical protein
MVCFLNSRMFSPGHAISRPSALIMMSTMPNDSAMYLHDTETIESHFMPS